jgi:DNA-binding NarL/FixJ family response regulator
MQSSVTLGPVKCQSVVLVDSRELLRDALYSLIGALDRVVVAGQAADGIACLKIAEDIHPDIVICAGQLPEMSGIELTRRLRDLVPAPRVIIVGHQESREWVRDAIQAGASAILTRRDSGGELVGAILAASEDRLYLSPCANVLFAANGNPDDRPVLTRRQREVLQLYAEGLGTKQIAYRLSLSAKTVSTHREQILQRLGLRTTSDLIRFAIREGIVEP